MTDQKCKPAVTNTGRENSSTVDLSRRTMLKAGVSAMPVVLTLQSGEALARSSNLIGEARHDGVGPVKCLDTTSEVHLGGTTYDLRRDGALVNVIPDVEYYPAVDGGRSADAISAVDFCHSGGSMKYEDSGWKYVDLPRNGIVVSAGALRSVSSRTTIRLRDWTKLT